ncbi:hypothetical protein CCR75_005543 [Bremia lactucae]|uniref:U1-type domain-containing protein n=1 Tax=Bremia lactucae TaxID=4779 RepID=A0A976IGK7_BRELC|nr:hypothetical protein CCR75_005543 [Bremia lactucae]
MGKPRIVCEYCNKAFENSPEARQRHNRGRSHKANVKLWYVSVEDQERRATAATQSANSDRMINQRPFVPWTPIYSTIASVQEQMCAIRDLPPSMHPPPPGAYANCRSTWG